MKNTLRELFVFYDREQRGFIPASDFKAILKELEPELPDAEIEEMVKELGKNLKKMINKISNFNFLNLRF